MEDDEALGIPDSGYEYLNVLPSQEGWKEKTFEFFAIKNFIRDVVNSNTVPEFQGNNMKLQFINYGDMQLVYVILIDERKYTLLVGQPATEFGRVKREYDNLRILGKNNKENIVVPKYYFKDKDDRRELYVTPYLYQARCVGVANEVNKWGMWVPEPEYHFQEFSPKERSIINSSMIAMLIKFFDEKNNLGIGDCRLGGGDFVLEKGFENEEITYENILKRIKLIAARELIHMSLEDYVSKLKEEFTKATYYETEAERDKSILINDRAKIPMSLEEVQNGIELGYELKKRQKNQDER